MNENKTAYEGDNLDLRYLRLLREQAPILDPVRNRQAASSIQKPGREMEVLVHRIIAHLENEA